MTTIMIIRDEDYDGKWKAPCSVEICLNNVDHAHALASTLGKLFSKAAEGGDMELNGVYVGHDVNCSKIKVYIGFNDGVDYEE